MIDRLVRSCNEGQGQIGPRRAKAGVWNANADALADEGLGLEAFGPVADDGVPEPLQFRLASSVSLMLIPTGGFRWVAGEDRVAPPGANECVLSIYVADEDAVLARYEAALAAGGTTVYEPSQREWSGPGG